MKSMCYTFLWMLRGFTVMPSLRTSAAFTLRSNPSEQIMEVKEIHRPRSHPRCASCGVRTSHFVSPSLRAPPQSHFVGFSQQQHPPSCWLEPQGGDLCVHSPALPSSPHYSVCQPEQGRLMGQRWFLTDATSGSIGVDFGPIRILTFFF